jgi:type III pantothenate kinase
MVLAFDIGNTNIVMGLYEGQQLTGHWRIDSNPARTVDDYGHLVLYILQRAGADSKVSGVVIGSVVPTLTYVFDKLGRRYFDAEPVVISGDTELGIAFDVDAPPSSVGADRLANAVAVRERYKCDCLVVDVGTATTFDLISADGTYHGGVISPGINTGAESLIEKASMLSRVKIEAPLKVIGRDTQTMMQSGIFYGAICQIDGLVDRLREQWGIPCQVIATGGFVTMLAKYSRRFDTVDPNLTLDGLRMAFRIVTGH